MTTLYLALSKCSRTLISSSGFGLIETIIAAAILSTAVLISVTVMTLTLKPSLDSSLAINLQILNTTITSSLQNDSSWFNTVQDPANAAVLDCLKSQADCSAAAGNLQIIRDAGGGIIYDGTLSESGFDLNGKACSSFSLASPSSQCIVQLTVRATPVCPATPCLNPAYKFTGSFKISSPPNMLSSLNMARFNFPTLRQEMLYHAAQVIDSALNVENPGVTCATGMAVADNAALSYPTGDCQSTAPLQPSQYTVNFKYTFNYSGGAAATDTANQSKVCFFLASSTSSAGCLFEWRQINQSWGLYANNLQILTPPASAPATGSPNFTFAMRNGLMLFYYNGRRLYVFATSAHLPLRVAFFPGSTSYAPSGFNPISIQF